MKNETAVDKKPAEGSEGRGLVRSWLNWLPPSQDQALLVLGILVLVAAVFDGWLYLRWRKQGKPTGQASLPAPPRVVHELMATPVLSPTPRFKLSDYSVQVLNGSGTPGAAGQVRELLADKGFENIEVGDANSYDYARTEVSFKQNVPQVVFTIIETAFTQDYEVFQVPNPLPEDFAFDLKIIVGRRRPE